jgi:hypothetical protein
MAILRSLDGDYYEVPDDHLSGYRIPASTVKEKAQCCVQDCGPGGDPVLVAVRSGSRYLPAPIWHNIHRIG